MPRLRSRINVLASEAYIQGDPLFLESVITVSPFMNIMIDSGAHTNWTIKRQTAAKKKPAMAPVLIDQYIDSCLNHYHGKVFRYIMLDVVREPKATERNLKKMLDAGLKPMPVFIEGWDSSKLSELMKIDHRLCVAGGVTGNDHYIRKRFRTIFKDSGDRAKIHGLGYYRYPDIFQVPIASSDSSSWCAGSQYGHIKIFTPRGGLKSVRWIHLFKGELSPQVRDRFLRFLLVDCEINSKDVKNPDYYRGRFGIPALVSTFAYLRAMEFGKGRGFEYFLAVVDSEWLTVILSVVYAITDQGFNYPIARTIFFHLRELRKKDRGAWIVLCEEIAREHQGWKHETALN